MGIKAAEKTGLGNAKSCVIPVMLGWNEVGSFAMSLEDRKRYYMEVK